MTTIPVQLRCWKHREERKTKRYGRKDERKNTL
jgi:hypothetical protein